MTQKEISKNIDAYIAKAQPFAQPILKKLRTAIHSLKMGIEEDWKWNSPCYSHHGLVCMTWSFSKHAAIHFFKGALLSDQQKILVEGEKGNVSSRFIKFTSLDDLDVEVVKAYIREAAELNVNGKKVAVDKMRKPLDIPDFFIKALNKHPKAKRTFESFPPSHKKEYVEYVMEAKKEETRQKRLAKSIEMMEQKTGLNDRYKKQA